MSERTRRLALILIPLIPSFCLASRNSHGVAFEDVLRNYLKDSGSRRMSGQGEFIHETFQKVVAFEDYARGIEFDSQEHRQAFIRLVRFNTGLQFGSGKDIQRHTYEKLYFDQGQVRKDIVDCPADAQTDAIPASLNARASVYAYDGTKTIAISPLLDPEGQQAVLVSIQPERIRIPKFQAFGLNDSGKDASVFLDALDNGTANVQGYVRDGRIHVTYILPETGVRAEFVFFEDGHRLAGAKMFLGNTLATETLCGEYVRSDSGEWYPSTYAIKKYTVIQGQRILAFSDCYTAIKGTVDFNIPIAAEVFDPQLPMGAHVIDYRTSPPREFLIERDKEWLEVDWNKFADEDKSSLSIADEEKSSLATMDTGDASEHHSMPKTGRDIQHRSASLGHRTWLQEWGYLAAGVLLTFSFMWWLVWRKRRRGRTK